MSEKPNLLHPFGARDLPHGLTERDLILRYVSDEFVAQDAKWGEQNHEDGTGPDSQPLYADTATGIGDDYEASLIRDMLTGRTEWRFDPDGGGDRPGTWADILLEEVFEALAEDEPGALVHELVQVAAVAQQWAAAVIRRERKRS